MRITRRGFIKSSAGATAGMLVANHFESKAFTSYISDRRNMKEGRVKFSVIGINHAHIHGQIQAVMSGGGEFVSFYAAEADLATQFAARYPNVRQARSEEEILEDDNISLVLSAAIPNQRARLGIRVMEYGKDYLTDKPGITSLEQLEEVKKVQKRTGRIYSILYSERFENKATVKAGDLVKTGAIGNVIQTIGLGPHRIAIPTRPKWFFDRQYFGGIICDIGSHQFDQFLFFTGSDEARILSSQTGNVNHPQYPDLDDFGDATIQGNHGSGYVRVDWFTPDGLNTWGDGRLTILGTEGYIEIRKNTDIAGREGANHLFLVNNKGIEYIDCHDVELPFGRLLLDDVLYRTETAMTQQHCFLATELALLAEKNAARLKI